MLNRSPGNNELAFLAFGALAKGPMKLPNLEDARADLTKILDCLLEFVHREGRLSGFLRFGFAAADWQKLADALKSLAELLEWFGSRR